MGDMPMSLARRRRRYETPSTGDGDDVFRFVICRLEDDLPVGRHRPFDIDRANGSLAFGIAIGEPGAVEQGLGTDAVNAVVDFAFGQLRHGARLARHGCGQLARPGGLSQGRLRREGRLRHAWYQDGRWSDDVRMAMLRDEWLALPRRKSWELLPRPTARPAREATQPAT